MQIDNKSRGATFVASDVLIQFRIL